MQVKLSPAQALYMRPPSTLNSASIGITGAWFTGNPSASSTPTSLWYEDPFHQDPSGMPHLHTCSLSLSRVPEQEAHGVALAS